MNESSPRISASSSTTLRPRNRRRTNEDDDNGPSSSNYAANWLDGPTLSSTSSRAVSPIPSAHPSRPLSRPSRLNDGPPRSNSSTRFLGVSALSGSQVTPSAFATGLWESSWSSLQGFASNFMSSDSSRASSPARPASRKRRPIEATHNRYTSTQPAAWGPSAVGDKQIGAGTKEDRKSQVQARKREALLAANGYASPDTSGRYKRRDSDEGTDVSVPPGENDDRDARVYLHKVKPEDTLAGVLIKYGCDPNVFRKANRLWPNDSIQVRKTVVLPVNACTVKGRRMPEPDSTLDHLGDGFNGDMMPTPTATQTPWNDLPISSKQQETPLSSIPTSPSISVTPSNPEDPPWKHDSWIQVEGFPDAVEIARLSRRTLGYFPRSRRKSQIFFDSETPPASFDLSRGNHSPIPPLPRETKSRSSSGSFLHGPGGVGTMARNVRSPGPAQDGLNKLFAKHLPDVAPRSSFESVDSTSSRGNGIENIGGAVEGWVRKIATKAAKTVQPQTPGGASGVSDLIELSEDVFEIGDHEEEDGANDSARREGTGVPAAAGEQILWDAQQRHDLHERFPPKGRIVEQSPGRGRSR